MKNAFDNKVNELFKDRTDPCNLDLHKLTEICCATERVGNVRNVLDRISIGMDDPTQVKSTRRMTKILNKLTVNSELAIMAGQFIERCCRDLDLDAIQQTTPIV